MLAYSSGTGTIKKDWKLPHGENKFHSGAAQLSFDQVKEYVAPGQISGEHCDPAPTELPTAVSELYLGPVLIQTWNIGDQGIAFAGRIFF